MLQFEYQIYFDSSHDCKVKWNTNLFNAPLTAGNVKVDFSIHLGFQITNSLNFFLFV